MYFLHGVVLLAFCIWNFVFHNYSEKQSNVVVVCLIIKTSAVDDHVPIVIAPSTATGLGQGFNVTMSLMWMKVHMYNIIWAAVLPCA